MTRVAHDSPTVEGRKTLTPKEIYEPMHAYPAYKSRSQFWWPPDGSVPGPTLTGFEPDFVQHGSSDTTLWVYGMNFTADSKIVFNDNEEPTTMHSNNVLSTGLRPGLFAVPAEVPVKVITGTAESAVMTFIFT